ncbi:MAG: 4Fe-4S binding protein [Verrucomicrobia bacterium]|nr:4Fe-4S binding protein [Verrucomicrobiota bacterium]
MKPDLDVLSQPTPVPFERAARLVKTPTFRQKTVPHGWNLLQFRPVRAFVTWSGFPAVLQLLVLAVFVALAVIGWGHYTPAGVNAKLYAKTNLVNLAIWGLWWPAIIWMTVLLGRAWCIVCPLELVSSQSEKLGRKLGLPQAPLAGWLAKGSLVVLLFAGLQMLVPGVQIHRVPHYTSLFLWTSLALAFGVGLFLKDRAFCRGFCPVALLLSAYGRGGMLAVRPSGQSCCNPNSKAPNARACPSLLNPARLNTNKDCLVCGDCVKADPAGEMQLLLRPPFSQTDAREPLASWPLTLFVMIVSGFVTYELCGVWKAADPVFAFVPEQVIKALHAGAAGGWIKGLWTIVAVPLLLWLVLGVLTLLLGGAKSLSEAWRRLALPMAVVVAAGHAAKGLEKFTSWAGFLPFAWAEPTGVQTALQMNAKAMPQPAAWFTLPTLSVLAMVLIGAAVLLALREARLADTEKARTRYLPIFLLGAFYFFLVFGWGGWLK